MRDSVRMSQGMKGGSKQAELLDAIQEVSTDGFFE